MSNNKNNDYEDLDTIASFIAGGTTSYFVKKSTESRVQPTQNHFLFTWTKYVLGDINPRLVSFPITVVSAYFFANNVARNKNAAVVGSVLGIIIDELEKKGKS